jgi:putative hydrolase of the HAD superfamily
MSIQVVTIDFWNTIFDSSDGEKRNKYRQKSLIETIDKLGIMITPQQFTDAMQASWEYFNRIWKNDHVTPSPLETVTFFWNYLKLPEDKESIDYIVDCFANSVLVYPPEPMPNIHGALDLLKTKYKLAIVSDTGFSPGTVLTELLKKFDLYEYFDAFSFSNETGVSKPHPKAYHTVLDQLDCKPENAIHIGDIEATDIIGAKSLNMYAIRYTGDVTEFVAKENPKMSKADIELDSWDKIPPFIFSLD